MDRAVAYNKVQQRECQAGSEYTHKSFKIHILMAEASLYYSGKTKGTDFKLFHKLGHQMKLDMKTFSKS